MEGTYDLIGNKRNDKMTRSTLSWQKDSKFDATHNDTAKTSL